MTNEQIRDFLEKHAEKQFKDFTSSLIPGTDSILGVRLPVLRSLAKQLAKEDWRTYLKEARDDTYEEIMLQGLVIGYVKAEMEELLEYAAAFIPKIHDWSVNDGFCSTFKIVRKQRVVAVMLMDHFLVPEYIDRVLAVYNSLKHEGYYCKMGVAWGIATAYAKFPQETQAFLLENELDDYTYNKAIQKMLESYRVSAEDKEMLRGRKRKVTGRKNVAKPEQ